ncbi:MAG: site-specific DNA-methyltransferase, partial [Casimicrobiaceae bacterium]
SKDVEALRHEAAKRINNPTAEMASLYEQNEELLGVKWKAMKLPRATPLAPGEVRARDSDLDPQVVWNGVKISLTPEQVAQLSETGTVEIGEAELVWRGKDTQDWSDLVVNAPPLYIQEKVHPKALIDDLLRQTREQKHDEGELTADLFSDFNGIPKGVDKTEFYQHDQNWTNRMILGDSLQVMASLAEREGLRGKVQCIYFDPPYGIKFNSNFQWSTTSRDVKDGNTAHITREPEQVKAFRDTWRDGIHSYLTYLRDRLTVARDLLTESGSIFVQIGDENVHRVRALLDEVFGAENHLGLIPFKKTSSSFAAGLDHINDYLLWYGRNGDRVKYRQLFHYDLAPNSYSFPAIVEPEGGWRRVASSESLTPEDTKHLFRTANLTSQSPASTTAFDYVLDAKTYRRSNNTYWKTHQQGMDRLRMSNRLLGIGRTLTYKRFQMDFPARAVTNWWDDTLQSTFATQNIYVVQTYTKIVQRCILMATDPGDLVLDPTCGSGTTATVAEQWGRRWITVDTSRVALALARARIMGSRYPFYLLADSREGQIREARATTSVPSEHPTHGDIRQGFVYERVPHITLRSITNNSEIDVIWERWQDVRDMLRAELNTALGEKWEEWEVPRAAESHWSAGVKEKHTKWWEAGNTCQEEIDASIAAKADPELLYDIPFEDKKTVRVAGPFTVESLSPHRVVGVDNDTGMTSAVMEKKTGYAIGRDFPSMILENLKTAGVQQAAKGDKITFTSLQPWPGDLVCAEGRYQEGSKERRAAIFIGPEFGTVTRPDLVSAAREAAEAGFDVLIACAFNFEAHTTEFDKLGRVPVLKARMNADLHMADDLKKTDKANLFVVFGEPDIEWKEVDLGRIVVTVKGIDVFDPSTGEIRSDDPDTIACWFIDTDYNEESFFVRHAYFLGANDPYKSLKTTLKAEINQEAWESLHSDTSRPFDRPKSGRIAVKVINHLGDEVMKVVRV